ncbi:MAG: hypothetical protein ABJN35_01090 [Erythrobacter sp.]
MKNFHRMPLALVAFVAATPALAHEADFLHNHAEGLMVAGALALAAGVGLGWKWLSKRTAK